MSRAFNAFSLGVWSTRFRAVFTASVFWCLSFLVYNMYHPRTGIDSVTESGSQSFRGRTLWLAVTFHVCLWQGLLWSLASSCLRAQDDLELLNPPACTFLRPGLPQVPSRLLFAVPGGITARASGVLGKHSPNWAKSPVPIFTLKLRTCTLSFQKTSLRI